MTTVTDRHRRRLDRRTAPTVAARPGPPASSHDVVAIAGRALRAVPRDLEAVDPAGVHRAVLLRREHRHAAEAHRRTTSPGFDYTAFQMPTAILLGVTGVSRAPALVLDVQNGYFDRLLLTPVRRLRDPARPHGRRRRRSAIALTVPILVARRSRSACASRPARSACSCSSCIAALWSLAFSGFGYAIALKTGNPAAVNSTLPAVLPVPVPHVVVRAPRPADAAGSTRWPGWNPVTYLLEGLRSLVPGRLALGRPRQGARSPSRSSARSACRCASPPSAAGSASPEARGPAPYGLDPQIEALLITLEVFLQVRPGPSFSEPRRPCELVAGSMLDAADRAVTRPGGTDMARRELIDNRQRQEGGRLPANATTNAAARSAVPTERRTARSRRAGPPKARARREERRTRRRAAAPLDPIRLNSATQRGTCSAMLDTCSADAGLTAPETP